MTFVGERYRVKNRSVLVENSQLASSPYQSPRETELQMSRYLNQKLSFADLLNFFSLQMTKTQFK